MSFTEAKKRGIIDQYNTKFIYNDNFGSVILRNEALIEFNREDWHKPTPSMSTNLCLSTEKMLNLDEYSLVHYEWEHLYEQCLNLITPLKFDTDTALFEVKDTLYSLVIVVLFRNRRAQVCFSSYSNY